MPQADYINSRKNYRMEFAYGNKSFKFSINPEEYTIEEGSRSLVTQTKGGAWVDDFGGALPKITIRGTTGVKSGGFKKFKELRNFIRHYYENGSIAGNAKADLIFYNYTDEEYFVVHTDANGFSLSRSASRPLLYQYEINLIVLRHASDKEVTVNFQESHYDRGLGNQDLDTNGSITLIKDVLGQGEGTIKKTEDGEYVQTQGSVLPSSVANSTSSASVSGGKNKKTNNTSGNLQAFASVSEIEAQLGYHEFSEEISLLAQETLKHILNGKIRDRKRASLSQDSFPYLYNKLCKNKQIEPHIKERAKVVVLELLAIVVHADIFYKYMAESDLKRLVQNIHTLINDLSSIREYQLAQYFRDMQRSVISIIGSNPYEKNVATQISDIKNAYKPEL